MKTLFILDVESVNEFPLRVPYLCQLFTGQGHAIALTQRVTSEDDRAALDEAAQLCDATVKGLVVDGSAIQGGVNDFIINVPTMLAGQFAPDRRVAVMGSQDNEVFARALMSTTPDMEVVRPDQWMP